MDSLIHIDRIQVNCLVKDQFDAIALAAKPLLKGLLPNLLMRQSKERIFQLACRQNWRSFYPILRWNMC